MSDVFMTSEFITDANNSTLIRVKAKGTKGEECIKTISLDDYKKLIDESFRKETCSICSGILPENTVAHWTTGRGFKLLYFIPGEKRLYHYKDEVLKLPVPSALMIFTTENGKGIDAWYAVKEQTLGELTPQTQLCQWPLGHVNSYADVCTGGVDINIKNPTDVPFYAEKLMCAVHSHANDSSDLAKEVSILLKLKEDKYPNEFLRPVGKALGSLLN